MNKQSLMTNMRESFRCVGSECVDHCCHGWDITIDKQTYQFYKNASDPRLKKLLAGNLIKVKKSKQAWGKFRLNENGACSLLDDAGLCHIQKIQGEEALSLTCAQYPRMGTTVGGQTRFSLVLSCPQAAKLLLNDANAMSIRETDKPAGTEKTPLSAEHIELVGILDELATMSTLSIDVRLWLVGMLLNRDASKLSNNAYFAQLKHLIAQGLISENFEQLPKIPLYQWTALKNVTKVLVLSTSSQTTRGFKVIETCFNALDDVLGENFELDNLALLQQTWDEKIQPLLSERPYIFDNYFKYICFSEIPRLLRKLSYQDCFKVILTDYFLIKHYLCLYAMKKASFSLEDMVQVIYSYFAKRQHYSGFSKILTECLTLDGAENDLALYSLLTTLR